MTMPLFEQSGAIIGFWALFGVFALGEAAMRVRSLANRSGTRVDRRSQVLVFIGVVGGILGGLAFATSWQATAITAWQWPLFVAGLILMAAGIFVRQWAIFTLGSFFTGDIRVHAQQTVVDWGPYRWVRHPSYSGLVIFSCGVGLALANWMSLLALAVLSAAALVVRIRIEEDALAGGWERPIGFTQRPEGASSPACGDVRQPLLFLSSCAFRRRPKSCFRAPAPSAAGGGLVIWPQWQQVPARGGVQQDAGSQVPSGDPIHEREPAACLGNAVHPGC